MRVGLFGAGRIGAFHAQTLAEHPDVHALLIADTDVATARALAEQVGGETVDASALTGAGLDAVVIAATTSAHVDLITACLDANLPTFCEKPIALGLDETRAVVERAESSGATVQIGFQRRFDAGYQEAKRRIDTGALGTIYSLRLASHDPDPPHDAYIPTSGGIYRDLHIHDFDVLLWLTGGVAHEVYARGSVRGFPAFEQHGDVDTSAALVTMTDGVLAVLTGGRHDPLGYDIRTEVFGSKDSISVGLDARTPLHSVEPGASFPAGPGYPGFTVRFADAYRAEIAVFLDVARGRAENPCPPRVALEALRLAAAADTSLREHRPVRTAEIRPAAGQGQVIRTPAEQ